MFDLYTFRARFVPAVVAVAPAFALASILVSWNNFGLPHIIATVAMAILLAVFSDVARRRGRAIEPAIIKKMGGLPSITMMRHSDTTFDSASKHKMHKFLGGKVGSKPPTKAQEADDSQSADDFYKRCGNWLRENTRDTKRFKLLFDENVAYGFRRNLLGLKWPALALNIAVMAICAYLLSERAPLNFNDGLTQKLLAVITIAVLHAVYIVTFVSESGVVEAAKLYARQLLLCCEALR